MTARLRTVGHSVGPSMHESVMIKLKRVYKQASKSDGHRILVERLWPRGLAKDRASIDLWLKEVAPSPALRKWFGHDPAKWDEFRRRYWAELAKQEALIRVLKNKVRAGTVTFVYAARDESQNSAVALKAFVERSASTEQESMRSTSTKSKRRTHD